MDPTIVIHHNDVVPPEAKPQVTQVGIPIKVCPAAVTLDSITTPFPEVKRKKFK